MNPLQPLIVTSANSWPLHDTHATRATEQAASAALAPPLMQRAGLAVARLACAIAPHARTVWVACGPGNNGGDGFEAAVHLQQWGRNPVVTVCGDVARLPVDARAAWQRARDAGVAFSSTPPVQFDVAVDALLGIGSARALQSPMTDWLHIMLASTAPLLCVDVPSGLDADTGCYADNQFATNFIAACARKYLEKQLFCLSLLTLKPGLFTAQGKDAAGTVWWDDLGLHNASEQLGNAVGAATSTVNSAPNGTATAWLLGADSAVSPVRTHASHKGSYGDVAVIGGAVGMTGAALLAARAALHVGAGRVFVCLLDDGDMRVDATQPELMFRPLATTAHHTAQTHSAVQRQPLVTQSMSLRSMTVVCGCGGGDAVRSVLPQVLSQAPRLVLDADALNAIAADTALQTLLTARAGRGLTTMVTPHPLEAARLLACNAAQVQANRLHAAQQLADRFQCTVILKGAGSIIAAPGQVPCINSSGNAKLATAGTGDVLAGMAGAYLAIEPDALMAACKSAYRHGRAADDWPSGQPLTASGLVGFL